MQNRFLLPCVIGVLIGAIVGFMLRPSVPLLGQLPLGTVLSGGADLQGFASLLRPTAETSRTYLIVGAVLGGIVGYLIALARPARTAGP